MKHREASRLRGSGRVEMTNATDENGVPVRLSAFDCERMSREAILEYQRSRAEMIASREAAAREADDRQRFEEVFVSAGGDQKDAQGAFEEHRRREAASAAALADGEALRESRRRIRGAL